VLIYVKVKWSRYRPGEAQRVSRGIALLFHDHGTRRGWVISSTPRPHFTTRKDPVPILQEAGWTPEPVWTRGKSRPLREIFFYFNTLFYMASYKQRTKRSSTSCPYHTPHIRWRSSAMQLENSEETCIPYTIHSTRHIPRRAFDPGPSIPYSVAILTELPGAR